MVMEERKETMKPNNKAHFFRPLLPGFQQQLSVPAAFYHKYLKGKNPEKVVLRSPMGKLWHVKMNGRLFEDGWEEFCEDHDLHVGDFIVFRHDHSHSLFDVLVFDPSTCQKNYPSFSVNEGFTEIPEEEEEEEEEVPKESAEQLIKKKKKGMTKFEGKAGSSVSQYPHFMVTLSSYAAKCSVVSIPKPFARENGLENKCCTVVLLNEQGKVWMARLGYKRHEGRAYMCLAAFRRANSLKAGDSCIFELIRDGEKPVLKITRQLTKKKKKGMTKFEGKAGSSDSQYPHFMLTLSSYSASCACLNIPKPFSRENSLENRCCKVVLLNKQGKLWMASLGFKRCDGQTYIKQWGPFCRENSLKAGDTCFFELIRDGEKPVLKITKLKPNCKPEKEPTNNVARAGSSSRNPRVHVTVHESYAKHSHLRIPIKFAKKSGLTRECPAEMTIRNKKGKSWTVSLLKSKMQGLRIGLGWTAFARSNGIKTGDVLMLELIKRGKKPVMRISGAKRGAKSKKKGSGTPEPVKAVPEIKQEV